MKRFNQTSFFTKLSKKWKFYYAEVISHNRLNAHWKDMFQDGFPHGEAYDTATAQQQEYKGVDHRAGLKCTWKDLHFHSENCGDKRWWNGVLPVQTCALSYVVTKTVVMYYAGYTAPLQPFIDAGLCPAPPIGKGKLEELTYLPEWRCTQFRDNFVAYCLYFRPNNLFVSSSSSFQWKTPVVQGMFSVAPKSWPLTKGGEKTTWMQTNSQKFDDEIHLAIDSVEKAMLLPANCPALWDDKVLRSDLVTFVPQAQSPPSTTVIGDNVQPVQQVLERSSRLAKPDTKTAAALQDSMSSIFALSMVGQPYDLTKMCELRSL